MKGPKKTSLIRYMPGWWALFFGVAFIRSHFIIGQSVGTALGAGIGAIGLATIVIGVIYLCGLYDESGR